MLHNTRLLPHDGQLITNKVVAEDAVKGQDTREEKLASIFKSRKAVAVLWIGSHVLGVELPVIVAVERGHIFDRQLQRWIA